MIYLKKNMNMRVRVSIFKSLPGKLLHEPQAVYNLHRDTAEHF